MSKDLKLKDLVLEHYRKVYETEMDGLTVRVWKPKTMGMLPTYAMLTELKSRVLDASGFAFVEQTRKVQWWTGNPDYGAWDAQIVRRFDPRAKTLDYYFAALLIRPFSKQAFDYYGEHSLVYDPVARLMLMWDSRQFDEEHGFDTSFGAYPKKFGEYLYSGKRWDSHEPVNDPNFDPCYDCGEGDRQFVIKHRVNDKNIETEVSSSLRQELVDKVRKYIKPTLENFLDFVKEHPDVPEVHYYTELTEWEKDTEESPEENTTADEP